MFKLKAAVIIFFLLMWSVQSHAHFGMVIPSTNSISPNNKQVNITLSFSHPFEGVGMDLVKPAKFYLISGTTSKDLLPSLSQKEVMGHQGWQSSSLIKRPGVYQFVMEPTPYWEPAEDLFIIHYTKTIVTAFGEEQGWETPIGLPTEIIPLLRPFGNYAGNSFTGQVLKNGLAVPNGEVEVEFYNKDKQYTQPTDNHITQVIKTDSNGIFTFTCPLAGWWGFSALSEADYTLKGPDNTDKNIELGAVIWVYFHEYIK